MKENQLKLLPEVDKYWQNGDNCAQSAAAGLLDKYKLQGAAETYYYSFYPFGGGFQEGEVCGIVSGSLAALSYILHNKGCGKDFILEKSAQFREIFRKKFGSITCYGLTRDFRDENHQIMEEMTDDRAKRCDQAIIFATDLVINIIASTQPRN